MELHSAPKLYVFDQSKSEMPSRTIQNALLALKKIPVLENLEIKEAFSAFEFYKHILVSANGLTTCGKGLTFEQARASAIMEYCERFSWMNYDIKNAPGYIEASYEEIKRAKTRTVDEDYFFCNFFGIKNKYPLLKKLKGIPMKWIKGYSFTNHCEYYYPIRWHNYIFGSNGLAAGNTYEEAIVQAICELIERECVYQFIVENKVANDVDIASIKNPLLAEIFEKLAKDKIDFKIKNISYEFEIPSFIFYGINNNFAGTILHKGVGHGTYLEPNQAIIRSVSEYLQAFSLLHDQVREKGFDLIFKPNKHYGFLVTFPHDNFYKSLKDVKVSEINDFSKSDFKEEAEFLMHLLAKMGYEVVIIDKTHPLLKIPVVRVFIPGFRSVIVSEVFDAEMFIIAAQNEALRAE